MGYNTWIRTQVLIGWPNFLLMCAHSGRGVPSNMRACIDGMVAGVGCAQCFADVCERHAPHASP